MRSPFARLRIGKTTIFGWSFAILSWWSITGMALSMFPAREIPNLYSDLAL